MDFKYILIAYKMSHGFRSNEVILEMANDKDRLLYLKECERYEHYRKAGYTLAIYEFNM